MDAKTKLRIAIIGCGGNGRGHLLRYLQMPDVEVVGLADPARASREQAWEMAGKAPTIQRFVSHTALLKKVQPDAVLISSPHADHFAQVMDALAAGAHVLCEKPLVCTPPDTRAIIAAAKRVGKILAVSYQRHTDGPYIYVHKLIQSGALGEITFVSTWQSQNWWASQTGTWRQKLALSCGGQLNDSGSHLLDIVLWMTGLQPESVFAFQNQWGREVDIDSALSVRAKNGALLSFSVVGRSTHFVEDLNFWGTEGGVAIRHGGKVYRWESDEKQWPVPKKDLPGSSPPDLNFIRAIQGREEIAARPEDALQTIRLTTAAWKSAKSGKVEAVK
jgi:predicted dehydrogenase